MVTILEELNPQANASCVSLDSTDRFIIPLRWLYFHYITDNLEVTESISSLRRSKKMTDKVFVELLSDFCCAPSDQSFKYEYLINCWNEDKQWRGLVPTQNNDAQVKITLQDRVVVETNYNCVYKLEGSTVSCTVAPIYEFRYNQKMLDFFGSKFPIGLKSLAPVYGEETAILG